MAIGKTNAIGGGAGGVGGILTVTAPANVIVSISKDGKSKTQISNAEGVAVFKGLETGTWTLTITNGNQTATKTVVITADYSTTITFFAATITITYPSGSTCTCSDGKTTLTAPDTSGTWKCVVPNAGTWTVSCTDGQHTASTNISVTADGQSKTATLAYELIIFQSGKGAVQEYATKKGSSGTISVTQSKIVIGWADDMWNTDVSYYTKNKINTNGYKTLRVTCKLTEKNDEYGEFGFGLMASVPEGASFSNQNWVSSKEITSTSSSAKTYDCPISGSGSYYFVLSSTISVSETTDIRLI